MSNLLSRSLLMALVALAAWIGRPNPAQGEPSPSPAPRSGGNDPIPVSVLLNNHPCLPAAGSAAGIWFYADRDTGAQILLAGHPTVPGSWRLVAALPRQTVAEIVLRPPAEMAFVPAFESVSLTPGTLSSQALTNGIRLAAGKDDGALRITGFAAQSRPLSLAPQRRPYSRAPVADSPDLHPAIADALVEWDWRMQDGIQTPREPRSYLQATEKNLRRAEAMVAQRRRSGTLSAEDDAAWQAFAKATPPPADDQTAAESRWLELHRLSRRLTLGNPLFRGRPLIFAKHVPSVMSHQLTQTYGYCARPGGGLFELVEPGASMKTRDLTPASLPAGNYMTPELTFDAKRVFFAYCPVTEAPASWDFNEQTGRWRYQIHELTLETGQVRALTSGDSDNFSPVPLPSGDIAFVSTRRGGFHRCGRGPCFVYTLARMGADGQDARSISFHETHEWDPCLLNDGRLLYTRWDYVDRNAVHYEQLWSCHPDGGGARIYYGNNTWNPTGVWEGRAIPGSAKIMAIAAPHHGMSAGSVILVDPSQGADGLRPLTRLTPEVRFPESETPLAHGPLPANSDFDAPIAHYWKTPLVEPGGVGEPTEAERRWPGHCYKSPWPLSEDCFVVSYSFDQLLGEPGPNIPNMFGLYLADAYGNKELLYRDPAISSLWARPVASRSAPPELVTDRPGSDPGIGTFFVRDVKEGWPNLPRDFPITQLRIIEVLLKTTPHADTPRIGAAFAAPGKQVLGTVPVEADGSALFEVPARTPVLFQALDAQGRAVQTMRSLVYLQPGERQSCVGCHEHRMMTAYVEQPSTAQALRKAPSKIKPGPDGSRPFSYPRLIQPILDRQCVRCHDGKDPKRSILTREPDGPFTKSYNALVSQVSFSAWGRPESNHEPMTSPLRFGTLGSPLTRLLETNHADVRLSAAERECFYTWMDANALFYGTFDAAEQRRQLAGE